MVDEEESDDPKDPPLEDPLVVAPLDSDSEASSPVRVPDGAVVTCTGALDATGSGALARTVVVVTGVVVDRSVVPLTGPVVVDSFDAVATVVVVVPTW